MAAPAIRPVPFDSDFGLILGGKKVRTDVGQPIINPCTKNVIIQGPVATKEHLDEAVAAARAAFPSWSAVPWEERAEMVDRLGQLVEQFSPDIAKLLSQETGKPYHSAALLETTITAAWARSVAKQKLLEEDTKEGLGGIFTKRYIPLGVCAVIVPWNFPLVLFMIKVSAALLTGNTVLVKPAPTTPLSTLKIVELAQQIFPPGVLSVLSGGDELGPWITAHPGFAKISFTGSTAVGRAVLQSAAPRIIPVTLELGGNDPAIVLPDVDIDEAAKGLFWAMFGNSGQICFASKRIYIHADIYESMRDALIAFAADIRIGEASDPQTQLGPIQNERQLRKLQEYIEDSRNNGYVMHERGILPKDVNHGYYMPIFIVDNPPDNARVVREEPFGLICPLLKWTDEDEVIRRANDSEYGLAASIWSKDIARAEALSRKLEAGTVWINHSKITHPDFPIGGFKMSGLGSDGGVDGLLQWVKPQVVSVKSS